VVGSVSGTFALTRSLNVIGVVGRAFRAPNLVEKYFQGATPEGGGYQVPNPDLKPEQSLNFDVGFKYRRERAAVEAFYFSNTISDAIRIAPTGTNVGRFPAYQNVNVDKLRDYGVEALAEVALGAGFSVLGHYTWLQSKNLSQEIPVGDSYSTKVGGELGWRSIDGRFALAGQVRHQGERKDINLGEASPVGPVLPPFTTYDARAAVRLPVVAGTVTTLTVQGLNLSNVLYSEAANTSFFRPEPGRRVVMSVRVDF
jgi:outer membrane receptor protein involved in Fe transport